VKGKWNLAEDFTKYQHSSAAYYECSIKPTFSITHYKGIDGNDEV